MTHNQKKISNNRTDPGIIEMIELTGKKGIKIISITMILMFKMERKTWILGKWDFLKAQMRHLEMKNITSDKGKTSKRVQGNLLLGKIHKNAGTSH